MNGGIIEDGGMAVGIETEHNRRKEEKGGGIMVPL